MKLYDRHFRCPCPPSCTIDHGVSEADKSLQRSRDMLAELEKELPGTITNTEPVVTPEWRDKVQHVLAQVLERFEAHETWTDAEALKRRATRHLILVTLCLCAASSAVVLSAVAVWRTL